MYNVSKEFINQVGTFGKEPDLVAEIVNEETTTPLLLHSFKPSFEGNIFKSIMQKAELEVKNGGIINDAIHIKYGLKVPYNGVKTELKGEEITTTKAMPFSSQLDIEGNTKQTTSTTGKNKLNLGQNTYSRLGIDITLNGSKLNLNGTVTTSGNFFNTDEINVNYIYLGKFKVGTYRFSKFISSGNYTIDSNAGAGTFRAYIRKSDATDLGSIGGSVNSGSGVTITLTEDTDLYIQIYCNIGAIFENYVLDFQLEEGNTTTELEDFVPNMPSPEFPSDIRNVGDNINIIPTTPEYWEQGTILKADGTLSANTTRIRTKDFYNIKPNHEYVAGIENFDYKIVNVYFYNKDKIYLTSALHLLGNDKLANLDTLKEISFQSPNDAYFIKTAIKNKNNTDIEINEIKQAKFKVEKGTIPTNYSENGYGNVGIKTQNRNICDNSKVQSIDIRGNGTYRIGIDLGILPVGTYYISRKDKTKTGALFLTQIIDGVYQDYNTSNEIFEFAFTVTKPCRCIIRSTDNLINEWNRAIGELQIEKGNVATKYIEHQEQTVVFPLSKGQLLHKGDYLAEDGIHQVRKTVYLKGTETAWTTRLAGTSSNIRLFEIQLTDYAFGNVSKNYSCFTHFTNNLDLTEKYTARVMDNILAIHYDETFTTVDQWKSYLAEQYANGTPVIVEYVLKEEIVIPYTEEQEETYKQLQRLKLYEDYNNIFSIDDIKPNLTLTYIERQEGTSFEYIDYNTFNPYSTEINYDTNIAKTIAYDNMLKFMIDYSLPNLQITYPCTILELVKAMCTLCGVSLYSIDFYNRDLIIEEDLFTNLSCTYRDIIDYICQATCTTAIIKDNSLYFKKPEQTNIIITPNLLKKLKIKEHFGGCNSLVLGRGDLNDNIYSNDTESINLIGLQEIKFDNNEIIDKRREEVIDGMFNQIKGLEYYSYNVEDLGIGIFEPCDLAKFQDLAEENYEVLVLNQSLEITSGASGKSSANVPDTSTTNYSYASDSQKRQTRTEIQVNKQDQIITSTIERQDALEGNQNTIEQTLESTTATITQVNEDLTEQINTLKQTVEGISQTVTLKGGNNIFYYAKEFWNNGTEDGVANLNEYTDTEIQQKSVSGNAYTINSGTSEQKQEIKNDTYTISFTYKKLVELATVYVEINGSRIDLTNTSWKEEVLTLDIDTNTIDFKIVSDTAGAVRMFDLMGAIGNEKQVWTQNPNETRTDTVTIGKGIQVNSSSKNTYARFDADGNRIISTRTGDVVTELTDQGVDTDRVRTDVGEIGGVLIQEIDGQTWFSSLL